MDSITTSLRLLVMLVPLFVVITLMLLALNLALPTGSYSPFTFHSPMQTIIMTIIGMISLIALMLIEGRGLHVDIKGFVFPAAVVALSFLIQFTADPRQLQQYGLVYAVFFFLPGNIPLIDAPYFTTIYLLPLFVYGGILGLLMSYLLSERPSEFGKSRSAVLPEVLFRGFLVVFIGPALLTIPIGFIIGPILIVATQFFPVYGEGSAGAILVVAVILSMYIFARLITSWDSISKKSLISAKYYEVATYLLELVAVYTCVTAAFSLMGGFLTDGTPPPVILPFDYILLAIFVTIPMSLLFSRNRIFPSPLSIPIRSPENQESNG